MSTAPGRPATHLNHLDEFRLKPCITRRCRLRILLDKEASHFIERSQEVRRRIDRCTRRQNFIGVVNARIKSSVPTT